MLRSITFKLKKKNQQKLKHIIKFGRDFFEYNASLLPRKCLKDQLKHCQFLSHRPTHEMILKAKM